MSTTAAIPGVEVSAAENEPVAVAASTPQQRHQQPRQPHQTDEKHNDEEDHSPAAFAEVGEEGMPGRQPDGVDEDRQAELEE